MHDFVVSLEVFGLFGALHHRVRLRVAERVTILTGLNGSGKTHVLKLLKIGTALDFVGLMRQPFSTLTLEYASGRQITFQRSTDGKQVLHVEAVDSRIGLLAPARLRLVEQDIGGSLPPYMEPFGDGFWIDRRDDEILSQDQLESRFGLPPGEPSQGQYFVEYEASDAHTDWLESFTPTSPVTLVETGRLDLAQQTRSTILTRHGAPSRRRPDSRISEYVAEIESQISEARRTSFVVSQRADRAFAANALDRARETVREPEIRQRYERLALLNQELHSNGLTEASFGLDLPSDRPRLNPTEKRILMLFLQDWEEKLQPLGPVHEKLQALRQTVESKLSRKSLRIVDGRISLVGFNDEPISVDMLSSGEQHLLAVFAMLIFLTSKGGLVLIDEPEISLHAAWKHAFLRDIQEVAQVNDLQVVIATHSTSIINGSWDLTEELSLGESE